FSGLRGRLRQLPGLDVGHREATATIDEVWQALHALAQDGQRFCDTVREQQASTQAAEVPSGGKRVPPQGTLRQRDAFFRPPVQRQYGSAEREYVRIIRAQGEGFLRRSHRLRVLPQHQQDAAQ